MTAALSTELLQVSTAGTRIAQAQLAEHVQLNEMNISPSASHAKPKTGPRSHALP